MVKLSTDETEQPLILVVDDEPSLVDAITYSLRREGWRVVTAPDGQSAIDMDREQRPDLIVLDVMLPGLDGLQVCRAVRSRSNVPILFLSARGEDVDRILGLEIGGDDYLTKPFVMRELVARVRANLRRTAAIRSSAQSSGVVDGRNDSAPSNTIDLPLEKHVTIGRVNVDIAGRRVMVDGQEVAMKPKEFELLNYLAMRPNVAVSRETLLRDVWNYSLAVDTRTVDVHIRGLRQKLEQDASRPVLIETVRGHGYRLNAG